jgi:hypothetical protein
MLGWKVLRVWLSTMVFVGALFCGGLLCPQEKPRSGAVVAPPFVMKSSTMGQDYRIGAGDVVKIDVWMYPEISRTIPVSRDGEITLPLAGVLKTSGLSAIELASLIRRELQGKVNDPEVTVTVVEIQGVNSTPKFTPLLPTATPPSPQFRDSPSPVPHLDRCSAPESVNPV